MFDQKQIMRTCEPDVNEVDDDDFTISSPKDTSTSGLYIYFKKGVKFLPKNLFSVLPNLVAMQLWNCSVASINENHFKGLSKLKILSLANNRIENVASDSFVDLVSLEHLSMPFNRIRSLGKSTFAALHALRQLYLNDNEIRFLHPKIFDALVNVEDIKLDRNEILSLDENIFESLASLRTIGMVDNKLTEIPRNLFRNNSKLEGVWLRSNKLTFIDDNVFDNLTTLNFVDLRLNLCADEIYFDDSFDILRKDLKQNCEKNSVFEKLENAVAGLKQLKKMVSELQSKLTTESTEKDILHDSDEDADVLSDRVDAADEESAEFISVSHNFIYIVAIFLVALILTIAYAPRSKFRRAQETRSFEGFTA